MFSASLYFQGRGRNWQRRMITDKIHVTMRYRSQPHLARNQRTREERRIERAREYDREFLFRNSLCKLRRKSARVEWSPSFIPSASLFKVPIRFPALHSPKETRCLGGERGTERNREKEKKIVRKRGRNRTYVFIEIFKEF